jgi:hypothetical protein
MGAETAITRRAAKEIGEKLVKLASKKAASRILGKLATNSKAWRKAFEHIAMHFGPIEGKASHAIFEKAFRSKAGVEKLIRTALTSLGRSPVVSKLTIDGVAAGKPCVILEKEFSEVIGKIGDEPCKILRIVVDFTGKPITAFPVKQFLGTGVLGAVLLTSATSSADVPRVAAVEEVYTAEQTTADSRLKSANDRGNGGWVGEIIDFLTFDSSPTSVDPQEVASTGEVEARANTAVQKIEAKVGFRLDEETEDEVRKDVRRMWGYYVPSDD